jgi:hypothetical protein
MSIISLENDCYHHLQIDDARMPVRLYLLKPGSSFSV